MAESMSIEAVLSAVDQNFTKTMEQAVQSLGEVIDKSKQTAPAGSTGAGGIKQLASSLGLVAIGAKAFNVLSDSIGGAVERFDTLNKFPVVMQALGYSARDTAKSTAILKKGVDGLPTTLQDVTSVAQQLAPLTGSATKASKSAIALNNAFLASGASVADSSRGLQQYTQMLSTGKVDMMSWRTLMETMPIALRKVANSFGFTGKSAEQDLFKALQSGQITMDQLNDRFIKLNKGQNGFAELAKKNSAGIMTSFTNLKNSVKNNLAEMLTDIDKGFKNAGLGSIAQVLDSMKSTVNGAFQAIGPAVTAGTSVAITAFKVLLAVVKGLFSFISQNRSWLAPLAVGVASFLGTIKVLTVGIKGVQAVIKGFETVKAFTSMIAEGKTAIGMFKNLAAAMSINPWVLLVAAIAAVVAGLVYFFTQTKVGRALWSGFVSFLVGLWNQLVTTATTVWNNIVTVFTTAVGIIKGIWSGVASFFSTIWQAIATVASATWQVIVAIVTTVVSQIKAIWSGVVAFLTTLWTGIVTVATTIWNMLVTVITTVVTAIQAVWSGFSGFMSGIWSGIVSVASAVWESLVSVISAVWSTIISVVSGAVSAVGSVVSAGFNAARAIVSSVMNAMQAVISSVWNGIKSLFSAGVNFIKSVVHIDLSAEGRAIMNSFFEGLKSVWNSIKSFVSGIAGWIKAHKGPISLDRKLLIPAGQAIMNGLNNGLIDGFGDVQSNVSGMADQIQKAVADPGFDIGANISNLGSVNSNYSGNLAIQDSQLQIQNNALLRRLVNKDTTMVLDDGTLVGYTAAQYDQRLGQNTALKDRWSR
ncbi:tape measure protein [Limosilactobacillus mucosae]|uniref:Tape measure protein n=1 Tax=Limosilactobacillus mucosae TaxID=97478 RepID=A0AAJ1HWI7_LIMMU|nr:tape measure protein [Limosilactobacillus mucosae]MDC2829905.1 tape measure protein [Limosilactobacillus mucosae]MDC2837361.1 tape measure protein [Limosilactobacillus mucosae]MDC2849583.1 tape measure protein [Limosilactobacillus mucosae]MDC2853629.1 tape measure protein [Limosilactobacillus mucosae]